jgi:hypothetical protein
MFTVLVVDPVTILNHEGFDYDFYKEVMTEPSLNQMREYDLYFQGIIRSVWNEVSLDINVICDTNEIYWLMFEDLKEKMKRLENIEFNLTRE